VHNNLQVEVLVNFNTYIWQSQFYLKTNENVDKQWGEMLHGGVQW
jgi:hypothetical protein